MDTVVGKRGTQSCLLVLTERKSRLQIIRKLKNKTMIELVKSVKEIIKSYPKAIKIITSDNGSEFMDAESIEQKGIKHFYTHSYCSGERASNEANNKFVRRFLPKGVSMDKITKKEVKEIQNFMNNYPRKIFNSSTSQNIYDSALNLI